MPKKMNILQHLRDHGFTLAWLVVALLARNYLASNHVNLPSQTDQQFTATTSVASANLSLDR